ncbi:hypothetical protein KVV02_006703 [Mortierella alpina]|uniref:RING-CH-type domain-containing protein n=1 Tax=Mortierella alpina TaxID=64518 RepID=A0A9P8A2M9_MORAP|nr:hypothetical protein KVV02_006703 [Mortierella alpina]
MGAGTTPHSNAGASTSDRNGHTMPLQNTPTAAGNHGPNDEQEPSIHRSYTIDELAQDDPTSYDSHVPEDERRLLPETAAPSSPQQPYPAGSPMQRARPSTPSQQHNSENTTQARFSRVKALFSRSSTTATGSGRGGQVGSGQGHSSDEQVSLTMGHDPHTSGDNESDDRRCRICLESDDDPDSEQGHLISPCLCKGSARYIHLGCLQQWREASPRKESAFSCDTCHYRYSFSRPWMAKVLGNESFLHVVTTLMVLTMVYLCGWVGHGLESSGMWYWKSILTEYPPPSGSGPILILGLDGWDYVWGLIMSAIFGLLFLVIRGEGAEFILIFAAIIMFFFGIFGAFAGIYKLAAKFNKQALDSMRETILEVK